MEQPESTTNGPTNFLAVHEFDTAKIDSMVTRGREFADSKLKEAGVPGIFSNTEHDLIETKLEGLIEKCNLILASFCQQHSTS